MDKKIILLVLGIIVLSGGSFFAGTQYNQNSRGQARLGSFSGMGRMRTGGGFTNGEIISKDDKSITVKLMDGGSKIIFLSTSTSIAKSVDGNQNDLIVGKQILVNGTANPDGSLTAQLIQIRNPQSSKQ